MENKSTPSEEIDLAKLLSKLGDGASRAWLAIMRGLAKLRRVPLENRASFILIIVASTIIGFSYTFFMKNDYFESTMILSSDYLNKRLVDSSIEKLNMLAREKDKKGLARTLHINDSLAFNLLGFETRPFVAEEDLIELEVLKEQLRNAQTEKNEKVVSQVIRRIEIENRHAFQITARTADPTVIGSLQEAIVNYFRSNSYIKKRIEINQKNLQERQKKLEGDLRKLDSLKFAINDNYRFMASQARQGSNNVILGDKPVTSPIDVYTQDQLIYEQLQIVNRQLYLSPDFEIVDGFTEFSEPASLSIFQMVLWSVMVGIVIAYAEVALRSFNNYLSTLR